MLSQRIGVPSFFRGIYGKRAGQGARRPQLLTHGSSNSRADLEHGQKPFGLAQWYGQSAMELRGWKEGDGESFSGGTFENWALNYELDCTRQTEARAGGILHRGI